MKTAIVGFDTEGKISYEYCKARGDEITICDIRTDIQVPKGADSHLGDDYLIGLDRFDQIIRTPGLHPSKILSQNPRVRNAITSQLNLFLENCPTKNIIGITGTKGKGTTSTLTAAMLKAAGEDVYLGGNIGVPPLSFLDKLTDDSWVVLELSSFQLIDLRSSPHIAMCLMVVPEHLDWHEDFEEYIAAKQQLFIHQNSDDVAIYYAENEDSLSVADASEGVQIPYFKQPGAYIKDNEVLINDTVICKTSDIKLLGTHNQQNVCAAVTAVWQVTQDVDTIRNGITSFEGLEHRLEFVAEVDSVAYYDDSFGTTPDTAIVAIEAFTQPKVVILGGSDKGVGFASLAKTVASQAVKAVIVIGQMGPVIADELRKQGFNSIIVGADNMSDIVRQAKDAAEPGDVILLSTACASFDMFKNYKDRGDQFKAAVQALA